MAQIIGCWKFNEGAGTIAEDSSGNNNPGKLEQFPETAPPLWIDSQTSNLFGLRFNGFNFVEIPSSPVLEPSKLTVAVWLKGNRPQDLSYVLSKGADSSAAASFGLYSASTNGLAFYIYDGENYYKSPEISDEIWNDEWFHAAGSYDGNHVRLYINGSEVGSGTPISTSIKYDLPTNQSLLIGCYFGASGLVGDVDEVMIWDDALTPEEIAELAKPPAKINNLCGALPTKDSVIPVTMLFLRRFLDGTAAANPFETAMQSYLMNLPEAKLEVLKAGLAVYDNAPTIKRDCIFDTRFDAKDDENLLEPKFILETVLEQANRFGRSRLYDFSSGPPTPGKVRPWTRIFPRDPDSKGDNTFTAPYPWICSINLTADNKQQEYRNADVGVPGNIPLDAFGQWNEHEFSKTCSQVTDPNSGKVSVNCIYTTPPPADGPFGFGGFCNDNPRYNFFSKAQNKTLCLKIPLAYPGQEVSLRGLNFFSQNCKVKLRKLDAPAFQDLTLNCEVMGDQVTPEKRDGKTVATCEVKDFIRFRIPTVVDRGFGTIPVPPGRYSVQVITPNEIGYVPVPGVVTPPEFVSNEVWLNVQPNPDIVFSLWTDEAFCHQETSGPGSDEPWFQAFVARYVPDGSQVVPPFNSVEIMNTEDVDDHEPIVFPRAQIFRDKLQKGEVFAVSVIGLEVDSEDAAKQQIKAFGDAYLEYWKQFYTQLGSSTAAGVVGSALTTLIKTGVMSAAGYAGGVALLVIAILGIFYALWAPADPIAYDFMVFDAAKLYNLTDPTQPMPPLSEDNWFGYQNVYAWSVPKSKTVSDPGGTQAIYAEDRFYTSREEKSKYQLVYKIGRPGI